MTSHAARRVAAAVARQAPLRARADPQARGSDWRTAVVATVGTTTVTTADGIVARRLQTYQAPAVGDQVVISRSGNGNWLAAGRLAAADGWIPLSLTTGWTGHTNYFTPSYLVHPDSTVSLCGLASAPGSGVTVATTLATLPFTLAKKARFSTEVNMTSFGVLDILPTGEIQIGDFSGTAKWAALDIAHFRIR